MYETCRLGQTCHVLPLPHLETWGKLNDNNNNNNNTENENLAATAAPTTRLERPAARREGSVAPCCKHCCLNQGLLTMMMVSLTLMKLIDVILMELQAPNLC